MSRDYDYRADYFRKHKGLFGTGIYFCSYCGRPITKRGSHIDHIMPKSKNPALLNNYFNTTIACKKCNLRKSDKVNARYLVQGYTSKVAGGVVGGAMGVGMTGVGVAAKGTGKVVQGTAKVAGWGAGKVLSGVGWGIKTSLTGIWWTAKGILGGIFSILFKNIILTAIIIAVIYFKFM